MYLKKYDAFIFDCDGVILNSNDIKTNAFKSSLDSYPKKAIEKLIDHHKKNGGISRYKKFEKFFNDYHVPSNKEKETKLALKKYAKIVYEELIECDYVPGVINFLKKLKNQNKKCFVSSGSDQEELKNIFRKRKINNYFKDIKGSPVSKIRNTKEILCTENIDSNKTIFIGDSEYDFKTAESCGIDFLYIYEFSEWNDCPQGIPRLKNFEDF